MLSKVNKVFKDNLIFVSSLKLYFVPAPHLFLPPPPHLIIFQNPWRPLFNLPHPVYYMNLRAIELWTTGPWLVGQKLSSLKISISNSYLDPKLWTSHSLPISATYSVADPGGWGACPPPPPIWSFFLFTKAKFTSKKYSILNKYEICLKMLEMAILETEIFKNFPWKLAPLSLLVPPPPPLPFERPRSAPGTD